MHCGGELDGFADRDAALAGFGTEKIALWFMLCPAAVTGSASCCWVTFACRRNMRSSDPAHSGGHFQGRLNAAGQRGVVEAWQLRAVMTARVPG
jgi:hypothetical protein